MAMSLYEIRTLITPRRTSLISYGEFESDLHAIMAARQLLRRNETLEVWRGQTLVYRIGAPRERPAAKARKKTWGRWWRRPGLFTKGAPT
jgi:hypothetical protein